MDLETPMIPFINPATVSIKPLINPLAVKQFSRGGRSETNFKPENRPGRGLFGTPWKESIVINASCPYMPFWEWQLNLMQTSLVQFELVDEACSYLESPSGQHRIITLTARSKEYRHIRMTYLDGGDKVQIFTSVCYPNGNHPLFGMDLLQFANGKRNLAICDFQPIHANEADHDRTFHDLLKPIRDSFPHLQDEMTDRFFDPTRYFSAQTLLGRFQQDNSNDPTPPAQHTIWNELFPAYQAYLRTHIQMVQQTKSSSTSGTKLTTEQVLQCHCDYDTYVAECDPAFPMFSSIFGPEVAESYVYDILFPLAKRPR
jgi:15,16-dihydrobiliverdin:ferredoxin oxidoreductase